MSKKYTFILMLIALGSLLSFQLYSQDAYSFSDDFESYNVGDYLAKSSTVWTTWSGTEGGSEDTKISDTRAKSGTKSVYLKSTAANGGPTDLVFPMPQLYDKGKVVVEANIFVDQDKGGYFNFQGGAKIGDAWTIDVYFVNGGKFYITENNNSHLIVSNVYPEATWFNFKITADLTINTWTAEIDGQVVGIFSTAVNKVSSLDFYPVNGSSVGGNGQSSYYLDDFKVDFTPFEPLQKDGALLAVSANTLGLTGQESKIGGELINVGIDIIKSFDVSWSYGSANGSQSFTGLNIATLERYSFDLDTVFFLEEGDNDLTVEITSINGTADDDTQNNSKSITTKAVTPAENKLVVGEELTGTWCGWCPRGAVALDYMSKKYPGYFQGIAVHGGDPMQIEDYLSGITGTMKSITGENPGYPSLVSMRSAVMDPAAVEASFLEKIQEVPAAIMLTGAKYDAGTRSLSLSVLTKFNENNTNKYNISVVIIENGLTGTTNQWAQANYYSHQSQNRPLVGAGHDWQSEPNPVPASKMVYDHVGRANLGGYSGVELSSSHSAGDIELKKFEYTLPDNFKTDNLEFVALILNPDGSINNANTVTFAEALENGFVEEVGNIAYHDLVINEFVADNDSMENGVADPAGEYDDWIEIYNNTNKIINLSHTYLSDDFSDPQAWKFPDGTTMDPYSYLIVWADKDTEQDGIHAKFKLSSGGEEIIFTNEDGFIIDSLTFGEQSTNVAYARVPNGTGDFVFQTPTFNKTNDITGVIDPENNPFSIYPNPVSDQLNIELSEINNNGIVKVLDQNGQIVLQKNITTQYGALNISNLKSGLYIIRVYSGKKLLGNKKFVILK